MQPTGSASEDDGVAVAFETKGAPRPTKERPSLPKRITMSKRRHSKAIDKTGIPPSRDELRSSAGWWRSLQCIGMGLHFLAPPRPPQADFIRSVPSTLSEKPGNFGLHFYLPEGYKTAKPDARWPVVVNFHGGGFTIGKASDDARFARFILERSNAIFVSVDYRLAPEYPFPSAVDDGADAILYLAHNATEFRIDANRMATSGFSAGGNIAITSLLRIEHLRKTEPVPPHKVIAIATWYPITDYTLTRAERRQTAIRPKQTLSPTLTDLFDASYLFPPELNLADPCLSPSKASDALLKAAMPPIVLFYTCEWDMLLREGEELAARLENPSMGKKVYYSMIRGVQHGWDKGPNPLKPPRKSEKLYAECSRRLRKAFEQEARGANARDSRRGSPSPLRD